MDSEERARFEARRRENPSAWPGPEKGGCTHCGAIVVWDYHDNFRSCLNCGAPAGHATGHSGDGSPEQPA